jgi:hypothetical protein
MLIAYFFDVLLGTLLRRHPRRVIVSPPQGVDHRATAETGWPYPLGESLALSTISLARRPHCSHWSFDAAWGEMMDATPFLEVVQ